MNGWTDKWIDRWMDESYNIKFFDRCYHVLKKIADYLDTSVDVYGK